jgi:hypothetical protein
MNHLAVLVTGELCGVCRCRVLAAAPADACGDHRNPVVDPVHATVAPAGWRAAARPPGDRRVHVRDQWPAVARRAGYPAMAHLITATAWHRPAAAQAPGLARAALTLRGPALCEVSAR